MVRKTSWWNASGTALRMTSRNCPMSLAIRSSMPSRAQRTGQLGQHLGGADVDERAGFRVEHDDPGLRRPQGFDPFPDMVAVGEEQSRFDPDHQPGRVGVEVLVPFHVEPGPVPLGQAGHVWAGDPVQQQQHRHPDTDHQAGQGVEDQHAEHRGDRGGEIGPGGETVDAAQPIGPHPVEPAQRREVDELDHGRDHHRRQGRFRQLLEKAGEEQQGDQRQYRHHQPTDLRPGSGGTVHRGLGQAAVDHHPGAQPRSQVGGAEADQLPVGRDLVARPWPHRFSPRRVPRRTPRSAHRPPGRRGRGSRTDHRHPANRNPADRNRSRRRSPRRGPAARTSPTLPCPTARRATNREPVGTISCRPAPQPDSARRPAGSAPGCHRDA